MPKTNISKRKMKARVQKSIDRGRAKSFDYINVRRGIGVDEVRCVTCGTLIRKLIPVADMGEERVAGNKTIIRERLAIVETNNYAEIMMSFDDGSKHHSTSCTKCVGRLDTDDLEVIYCADMNQWNKEEESGFGKTRWSLLSDRTPISYERVK